MSLPSDSRTETGDVTPRRPNRPVTGFLLLGALCGSISLLITGEAPASLTAALGTHVTLWAVLLLLGAGLAIVSSRIPDTRQRFPLEFVGKAVVGVCFVMVGAAIAATHSWASAQFSSLMMVAIGFGFLARSAELVALWRKAKRDRREVG